MFCFRYGVYCFVFGSYLRFRFRWLRSARCSVYCVYGVARWVVGGFVALFLLGQFMCMEVLLRMKKYLILIVICFLLRGGVVYAEELPYENTHLTNNRFEATVSMKPYRIIYRDDVSYKIIKPTKKELKQAKQLYKKIIRTKGKKSITVSTKKYKNLTRLMGIIKTNYFYYSDLDCSQVASYNYYRYKIKGSDIQHCFKQNKMTKSKYKGIIKELGINKNTTEHDAVLLINNYIVNFMKYNYNSSKDIEVYGADVTLYTGVGVCADYANMFYNLAIICGLKCGVVIDEEMNHAYNIVYIGGKPTYIDVCWNDTPCGNVYIFLTKEELLKSHGITRIEW